MGGPQAGIVAGKARQVAALKRHPFFRALRCDKLVLTALQTTVEVYLNDLSGRRAPRHVPGLPVLELLNTPPAELEARAHRLVAALQGRPLRATVARGQGQVGGGTLPKAALASVTLELEPSQLPLSELAQRLRGGTPPVIGTIAGKCFRIDLRTVFPAQDEALLRALQQALGGGPGNGGSAR